MIKQETAQMSLHDDFEEPFENIEPLQWGALRELCQANEEYFMSHQDENGVRIRGAVLAILDHLVQLLPLYKEISKIAPTFDYDVQIPANGYRSFLILVDKCIAHSRSISHQIYCQKDSMFFRKSYHMREIEACSQLLASLCTCLKHLQTLSSWTEPIGDGKPSLFIGDTHNPREILNKVDSINQYCFYGRCLGFQFHDNLKPILKTIMVCMATFSEAFYANGTLLARCANSVKYMLDPEVRARRVVDVSQHADISFCQAFWFLNEADLTRRLPSIAPSPPLAINQIISIPPEGLTISALDGTTVQIPVPNSHIGKKPIHVRLLSSKRRVGMVGSGGVGGELHKSSNELIIHCHGGGFVAQTSLSHETYLKSWAVSLDIPIVSVDYSLAPEAPFPRAFEEVLYAYAWALNHASTLLGSTAEKILLVGDSAGANLNLSVTLKCIQLNIRKPDGIFMAYTPVLVDFVLSPSRLLCLTDPLLPMGFLVRCLKAYTASNGKKVAREKETDVVECTKSDTESFAEVSESDLIALALSPNGDETNDAHKLASLPSDSTLNSVSLTEVDGTEHLKEEVKSEEYIKKFLGMYRNSGMNASTHVGNGTVNAENHSKHDRSWSFFGWSLPGSHRESRELDVENMKSPLEEFVFTVPRDPFLSPYLAADSLLAQLPPITMLSLELDPCLDDSIMFARKLRLLGVLVTLDVLPGLPHGFLNLTPVSREAIEGSDVCVKRIQELLAL